MKSPTAAKLVELSGKSLLPAKDPVFHPILEGLVWKFNKRSA